MADTDTILAATVVYLHAWKDLSRNKLVETFLITAAITQIGGLCRWLYLPRVYCKYSPKIPWSMTLEVSSLWQYHINSALCSWKI